MNPLHVIQCVIIMLSTLKYSPAQSSTLPIHLIEFGRSHEDFATDDVTPKREIRQVVPTSFKPICKPGERLNIRNECVPNHKLPVYSPKTKKPTADFVVSFTTPTPPSIAQIDASSNSRSEGTTHGAFQESTTSSTRTTESSDKELSSSKLATVVMHTLKELLSQKTEKYLETTTTNNYEGSSSHVEYSLQSSYLYSSSTLPSTSQIPTESTPTPRKHKCYFHKDHSTEKLVVNSAYEDYDY